MKPRFKKDKYLEYDISCVLHQIEDVDTVYDIAAGILRDKMIANEGDANGILNLICEYPVLFRFLTEPSQKIRTRLIRQNSDILWHMSNITLNDLKALASPLNRCDKSYNCSAINKDDYARLLDRKTIESLIQFSGFDFDMTSMCQDRDWYEPIKEK